MKIKLLSVVVVLSLNLGITVAAEGVPFGEKETESAAKPVAPQVEVIESNHPGSVLEDAVAYWPLGGNANDASGNGHDGTLEGGPKASSGIVGQSLSFDGVDDKVMFGTGPALDGQTDFTLSAWVKTTATTRGTIIQQRYRQFKGEYQLYINADGTVGVMLFGQAHQFKPYLTTKAKINDGNWHHVVFVRQGKNGQIYIDGTKDIDKDGTSVQNLDASISVGMGADIRDNKHYLKGQLDEVAIWKRTLSAAEIETLHKSVLLKQGIIGQSLVTLQSALNSNQCLSVTGTQVQLNGCDESNAQKWIWDGLTLRTALAPQKCLNLRGIGGYYSQTKIDLDSCTHNTYDQQWILNGAALSENTTLKSVQIGGCLEVNGTNLQVTSCNGTKAQQWISSWNDDATLLRNVVTIYEESDYTGTYNLLPVGQYNIIIGHNTINQLGIPDDSLSSLKVPKGLKVTLYENIKFEGRHVTIFEDTPNLGSSNFDNVTSSIKIERK